MTVDLLGWLAAALTLQTFVCQDMRRLRGVAIFANFAFIAYASQTQLWPVLALHLVLAPLNVWRLAQLRARAAGGRPAPVHEVTAGAGSPPAPGHALHPGSPHWPRCRHARQQRALRGGPRRGRAVRGKHRAPVPSGWSEPRS